MKKLVVAIDGPAGAGKSTIAKLVAEKIGYAYLDTGAMYRAVTWKFLQTDEEFDGEKIGTLAEKMVIELVPGAQTTKVLADGLDITGAIRTAEVTKLVSAVAAIPRVRRAMVTQQRRMSEQGGVILDGRDIGTVVFPHAEVKIFLTASARERAQRRCREMLQKGMPADLAAVQADIEQRDWQDSHREVGPLKQAEDAYLLDSTGKTLEQVRDEILQKIEEKC